MSVERYVGMPILVPEANSSPIRKSSTSVERVVTRWKGGDLAKGIVSSTFFKAFIVPILAIGILFAVTGVPPDWLIATVTVSAYVLGILIQLPFNKGMQKFLFELATIGRLKGKNYDEIIEIGGVKVFVGAMPNRLRDEGEVLVKQEKVYAVLSLNESCERDPLGLSHPYTQEDWSALNVHYKAMEVPDHTLLDDKELDEAAHFIDVQVRQKHNVYVHCRAGHGRSAMAAAGYLIKHQKYTADQTKKLIEKQRPSSTIAKKVERLNDYAKKIT